MVDVPEWPKWLNDVVTKLDASSCEQGPSAVHWHARISPTLRKELRDICVELHQCHRERAELRTKLADAESAVRTEVAAFASELVAEWQHIAGSPAGDDLWRIITRLRALSSGAA